MPNSFLIGALNKPKKKLCPKLEKNVKIKPNIIIFLLIEILIINDFSKLYFKIMNYLKHKYRSI